MKRLNLNNAIATTAMLTKTNAMKNKMNLLFRFAFIVISTFLGFSNLWGWSAVPRKEGNVWYSLYDYTNSYSGRNTDDVVINSLDVYPPCDRTDGQLAFSYMNDQTVGTAGEADLTVTYRNSGGNTVNTASRNGLKSKSWTSSWFGSVPDNLFSIHVVKTNYSMVGRSFHMKEIRVPLARHFRFGSSNEDVGATTKTFGSTSQREAVTIGTAKAFAIPIRSFLTATNSAGLKIYASGNTAPFKIKIGGNFVTIDSNGLLFYNKGGNTCAIRNGSGNYSSTPGSSNNYDIEVWYFPSTENGDNLTLTIKDIDSNGNQIGGTETGTINIYAQGVKHTMSFETFVPTPSASQSFTMTNFTGNVSVSALAPFEVSTDNSNWVKNITVSNNTFYVRFAPTTANADEQIYNDVVTMTSNGTTYNLNVSGKAKKQQASITWNVPGTDLVLPLNSTYLLNATFLGDPVTQYSSSDSSVIDIVQNDGTYYIEAKGAAGQSAVITASAGGTDVYTKPADVSYTFTISPKTVQYIKWDQDLSNLKMASATTHLSVTLTAISCDKGSDEGNGNTVTYSYSTDGTNFIDVSGSTMTFSSKGTYYLKAYTAETGDATRGYLSAEMIRIVIVRIDGESCSKLAVQQTEIKSGNDLNFNLYGLPGPMSGTLHYGGGRVLVKINNSDFWQYEQGIFGRSGTKGFSKTQTDMQGVTSLTFRSVYDNFGSDIYISPLNITQQTYFNQGGAATNTIPFGNVTVGVTSGVQTFTLNFANVPEIEIVPTSGNTDQFTVTRTNVSSKNRVGGPDVNTVDCNCFGNATYSVTFHPTSTGGKSATYIFKAAIEGATDGYVQFTLTVTGTGTVKTQSLSWNNNHSLFTTSLNALSGTIDLTGAAVSYDGTTPTGLIPTYSLADVTPAGAVELTDNDTKLKINSYGSFVLKANQSGSGSYEPAEEMTHEAINISRVTPELHWTTIPDNSTEVFQTVTIGAATNDTQGTIGGITYSISPDNAGSVTGDQLTLSNCVEATIYATIAETGTYSERTISHTFTPAKVTPVLQGSVTSLSRTALTNLNISDLGVSIKNKNDLWHDISITYSSDDPAVAKLEGDHFSLLKSGTCTITAKVNAGVNNNVSNIIQITLNVERASQNITWNPQTNPKVGDHVDRNATAGTSITYESGNTNIISDDGQCLRAGVTTYKAIAAETVVYNSAESEKSFKVDFADDFVLNCSTALIGTLSTTTLDMSQRFVPSGNGEYTASAPAGSEFSVTEVSGNTITIKFDPTSVDNGNDTQEKSCGITITDNGQTYTFYVKATAEKKNASLVLDAIGNPDPYVFSTITPSLSTQTTDAASVTYTYNYNGGTTTGASFKLPSIAPVNVTATTPATTVYKAGTSNTITVNPQRVTPTIVFGTITGEAYVGTDFILNGADWASAIKTPAQPARSEWTNEQVDIVYSTTIGTVADDGKTLSSTKAGYATITAHIYQDGNHTAADNEPISGLKIDFATNFALQFTGNVLVNDEPSQTTFDMADHFVPDGDYTVAVTPSGSGEFSVSSDPISDNKITVTFAPTSVNSGSDTEEKTCTLQITNNGQVYTLMVRATAEKRDAGLTISYTGETFAFSTITLSNTKETDADVTYSANGTPIADNTYNTYKIPSIDQVTITASTNATTTHKAGTSNTITIDPLRVTPKVTVTNWSGRYPDQKVGTPCAIGQADWDVDETISGQPAKEEWADGEVTIVYASSNDVAEVNGSYLEFRKAGLVTITASIPEEKNHYASTNSPTRLVKVDFSDDALIDCGTAYVGESPATYDITGMIVLTGTGAGAMTATSDNPEFSVDFSNGMVVVGFRPTSYNETRNGTITFTETVDGVQYEYHLNVTGHCDKHTPSIEWIDGRLLQSNPTQENRQLTDLLKSYAFIDGATIASSDTSVIKVFGSNGQSVDNNVPGRTFWVHDEGQATITIDVPETGNHWPQTVSATFEVTNDKIRTIVWDQQDILNDLYVGDAPLNLTARVVDKNGDVVGTVSYSSGNNGIVSASGDSLTIVAAGTTTLTATASDEDGYTTPTLTYNVEVKEPNTTACPEHVIYQSTGNITAVGTVEFDKDDKGRCYPAGELTYNYALSKNDAVPLIGIEYYRTITVSPDGPVDHSVIVSYTQDSIASQSGSDNKNLQRETTGLIFGGDISTKSGIDISRYLPDLNPFDRNNYFTNVKVTQATYLEAGNLTSYDFGTQTVGEPERVLLSSVAKYSHINGPVRAIITQGNEYFKVVDSEQNNFGSVTDCNNDFGDVNVLVEYVADDNTEHTGELTIVGYIGAERIEIPVTLTGKSEKTDPVITWDAGSFLRAGDNTLHATTSATGATVSYELVSPTDNPDMQIAGPDAYGGWIIYIPSGATGEVQVKALSSETKSYNAGEDIKTFTITTKKIQTIVWPAGFENGATILVGDEGKSVSGFGTDPEGGTVTVFVSDAGSTGANINNGILNMTTDGIVSLTATATRSGDEYEDAVETRTFYLTKGGSCSPYCLSQTITRTNINTPYSFASGSIPVALSGELTGTNIIIASSYTIQDNNGTTISQGSNINRDGPINGHTFTGTETGIKVTELTIGTLNITVSQKTDKILLPSSGNTIAFGEYELLKESTAEEATIEYWNMPYMVASLEGDNASEFRYEQVVTGETAKCNCHGKIKYKLYFKPTTEGEKTCTFKIEYSTIEPPLILTLTGKGKKIQPVITLVKPLPDDMNVFDTVPLEGSDDDTYTKAVPALPIKYVALASAESTEPSDVAVVDTIDGIQCLRFYKKGNFYLKAYIEEGTYNKAAEYIFDKDTVVRGTLKFIVAGKWTDAEKWSRPDIVRSYTDNQIYDYSDYNVLIADSCFIGKDEEEVSDETTFLSHTINAACHDLSFADNTNAKLVIGEASTLKVVGNLTNDDPDKLLLTANYWGQASVVFGNDGSIEHPNPKATIEMYIPEGNGSHIDPKWQYRGICVNDFKAVDGPWECMAIYWWKEADNSNLENGCWNLVTNGGGTKENINLTPWTGYCFANICSDDDRKAENWLTYTGTLINSASHEYILTRTENKRDDGTLYENCGVNLLTNSYPAPVTIGTVNYGNAKATVTFYNAGTHADWKAHHAETDTLWGEHGEAGQMTVCPKNTSKEAHAVVSIPAGQSFFVTANSDGDKVKFSYDSIITYLGPSRRMFLPGEHESEYNVLGIRVKGKENGDRLVLLECETCTRQYDNGYDGYKMPGKEGLPQIYAYNKFGNTAVNADSTFNKQYVGFMAGSDDETYTISFETDRLYGYHSLYLTDRKLNETVDILAGETYQFKGYTVGENMRFQINGITEQEWNNDDDNDDDDDDDSNVCDLRVVGNTLYVQGFTTDHYPAARIELFDMTGNLVWSTPLTSERLYDLPSLPQGIYTIRLGDCHTKYVSR